MDFKTLVETSHITKRNSRSVGTTIPRKISERLHLDESDIIVWVTNDDSTVTVAKLNMIVNQAKVKELLQANSEGRN